MNARKRTSNPIPEMVDALLAAPATLRGPDRESDAEWLRRHAASPVPTTSETVLLHGPPRAWQSPGGGENQLLRTARRLESRGVPVRLFNPWTDRLDPARARLLHLFGMSTEGLELARIARARGLPVVVSPICWYDRRAIRDAGAPPLRRARDLALFAARRFGLGRSFDPRAELCRIADRLLPNSMAEAEQLIAYFGADPDRIKVVPNGVDLRFRDAEPGLFLHATGLPLRGFLLFVGRLEPRKDPLGAIRAARAAGRPLALIGEGTPDHADYARRCREESGPDTHWIGPLDHDSPPLASAYAAARALVLPSWFETPGLAALEAALAGCAVVVTERGCAREYFGDRVVYVRPNDPDSLRAGIERAWRDGPDPGLAAHVAWHYPWAEVARLTQIVYDSL